VPAYRAVIFDFFGTLTRSVTRGPQHADIARNLGCDPEVVRGVLDRTFRSRARGTFGSAEEAVAENASFPEIRANGAPAQGNQAQGNGYNVPSLLGTNAGAPYLHDGGARTLEALFAEDPKFSAHYRALAPNFLEEKGAARERKVNALVSYLLYIDENAEPVKSPDLGPTGGPICK